MRRVGWLSLTALLLVAAALYGLSAPQTQPVNALQVRTPDPANGAQVFWAGGCASCHAAPESEGELKLVLSGGLELATPFGQFVVPNISPHPEQGIGRWSSEEFVTAMRDGVAPDGSHYYPAFPYTYYRNISVDDLLDLKSYLDSLPADDSATAKHSLSFPYNLRRGIGLWKRRYLAAPNATPIPTAQEDLGARGAYLVQGAGHCGFCHTPRDKFGGPITSQRLSGAVSLETQDAGGFVPNLTPHRDGLGSWSADDIAYSLETGFDPSYDSFGGSMVDVQENMARLKAADRAAIGTYLKSIEPLPNSNAEG